MLYSSRAVDVIQAHTCALPSASYAHICRAFHARAQQQLRHPHLLRAPVRAPRCLLQVHHPLPPLRGASRRSRSSYCTRRTPPAASPQWTRLSPRAATTRRQQPLLLPPLLSTRRARRRRKQSGVCERCLRSASPLRPGRRTSCAN